jgi:WD40 repeat protein
MKLEIKQEFMLPTSVLGMAVNRDGSRIFAACLDGKIYAVQTSDGKHEVFAEGHTSYASGCVLLPDEQILISAGYDGQLLWHDANSRALIRRVQAHQFWSWQMALSPDGKRVASVTGQYLAGGEKYEPAAEREPSVKIYDTATGALIAALTHVPPVLSVAFSPDSQTIAAANLMGEVRLWNLTDFSKPVAQFTTPDFTSWGTTKSHHYCGGIYALQFSPDGQRLLCGGMGPMGDPMAGNGKMTWQRWNWQAQPPAKQDQINSNEQGSGLMESLAYQPDGAHFLMAGRMAQGNWNAALFDANTGALQASLDTKCRITRSHFVNQNQLWLGATNGQPSPKDGQWPAFGKLIRCEIS